MSQYICSYKLIHNKITVNHIFMYTIKSAISDIHMNVSTLILFLGIFLTEYQRKNYYQTLRCKKSHFIIFICKRVILIRIELLAQTKNANFFNLMSRKI